MGKLRPFVRKDSYMPNKKWIPFVIGNGYTTTDGAGGPAPEYETVTGNPVSFNALTPFPLRKLSVAFSPVQSLNGYDNPWPAGGGKNKCNAQNPIVLSDAGNIGAQPCVIPAGSYVYSATTSAQVAFQFSVYNSNGDRLVNLPSPTTVTGRHSMAFTISEDAAYLRCYYNVATTISDIQVESGSSATSYAPYSNICPISGWSSLTVYHSGADTSNPQTISISLGSTVYSGTLDVVTGVGEITGKHVDLGNFDWSSHRSFFYASTPDKKLVDGPNITENIVCDTYPTGTYNDVYGARKTCVAGYSDQYRMSVYDPAFVGKTGAEVGTLLTGVKAVYELATPIPIQLTPQEVQSLAGDNTIWSDANQPLTVEYRSN